MRGSSSFSEWLHSIGDPAAIDAATGLAEVGLDAVLDDGVLRDIPIVGSVIGAARGLIALRDRIFVNKIATFLREFRDVPAGERASFDAQLSRDPKLRTKVAETLLVLLERADDRRKAELLARLLIALLREVISESDFHRLARGVDRLVIVDDLTVFANWSHGTLKIASEVGASLVAAGLVQENSSTSYTDNTRDYRMTRLGELVAAVLKLGETPATKS